MGSLGMCQSCGSFPWMEFVGTVGCVEYLMLQPRRLRVQDMGVRSSQQLDQPAIVPTWLAAVRRQLTQLGYFAGAMDTPAAKRATPKLADAALDFTTFETTCTLAASPCDARSQCLMCAGTYCTAHQVELNNSRDGWINKLKNTSGRQFCHLDGLVQRTTERVHGPNGSLGRIRRPSGRNCHTMERYL